MNTGANMHPYTLFQTEEKGRRFQTFDCDDKGVYTDLYDRSLRHEERVQICTLILSLVSVYVQTEEKGRRFQTFDCDDKGCTREYMTEV